MRPGAAPPSVCIVPVGPTYGLADALQSAVAMLVDAGLIRPVEHVGGADILHSVGPAIGTRPRAPHQVHSVSSVPVRAGRLAATPFSLHRERRQPAGVTWLVHGQTAGRLLVDAGLVTGARLRCAPLLHPPLGTALLDRPRERAVARERLGVPPGVRVVLALEPDAVCGADSGWAQTLRQSGRRDAVVLRTRPVGGPVGSLGSSAFAVRCEETGAAVERTMTLPALLAAADIYIAARAELRACSLAVAAADWGIPVVAAPTDSAAELVLHSGRGAVVPATTGAIVAAVIDLLDSVPARPTSADRLPDDGRRLADFARALLASYRSVLSSRIGGAA